MSGRPVQNKANIPMLQKLANQSNIIENRPIIALVMRECGCTFTEIAAVFGVTRQQAETVTKNAQAKL